MLKMHINFLFVIFLLLLFGCTGTEDAVKPAITDGDEVDDIAIDPEELESPIIPKDTHVEEKSTFGDSTKEIGEMPITEKQTPSDGTEYKPAFDWPKSIAMPIENEHIEPAQSDSSSLDYYDDLLVPGACELGEATAAIFLCEKRFRKWPIRIVICMASAALISEYCQE